MSRFMIEDTPISGVKLIHRQLLGDARGFFCRMFCADELREAGWTKPIAQINHSRTTTIGAVRGMHYQHAPHGEMKLVSCIHGRVFDVVVDLRKDSPTYLQWYGVELSQDNATALLIPENCAHGFQALTGDAELLYCTSHPYHGDAEGGVNALDPKLASAWPLAVAQRSGKDAVWPLLDANLCPWSEP